MEVLRQSSCCDSQPESNLSQRATSLGNYSGILVWSRPKDPEAEQMPPLDALAQLIRLYTLYGLYVFGWFQISARGERTSTSIKQTETNTFHTGWLRMTQDDSGWLRITTCVTTDTSTLPMVSLCSSPGFKCGAWGCHSTSLGVTEGRRCRCSVCWVQNMIFGEVPWQYDKWKRELYIHDILIVCVCMCIYICYTYDKCVSSARFLEIL